MIVTICQASRHLGRLLAACLLTTRALGGTLLHPDKTAPLFAANNVADPQVKLTGAIILLFAASLLLLAVGHVLDSVRSNNPPFR
ncbi:MAG: hypothetical protein ACP5XB_18770 [Isosphaeraceae bacterium]